MKRFLAILLFFLAAIPAPSQQAPGSGPVIPKNPPQQKPSGPVPVIPLNPVPQQPVDQTPQAGAAHAPTPPDYSQEAYVVEQHHQSVRFENDGTGREQLDARVRIVGESGVQALGQLKVGYSALSDQLEIAYVRVLKPDGTVVTAQESAIQDLTIPDAPVYTDYHEKHISVPSLRPGDTLEYRFIRTITKPLAPGQFWTSYGFSEKGIVLDEQLEVNVPEARQIKLKSKPGYEPKITDEGDRRIYRWNHSHLKDQDEGAHGKKKKKETSPEDDIPSVQLTTFQSWEELGDWYRSLEKERRQPNDALKAEAAKLVEGKTDDMAKVKALYDYVSRNIRYVSLSLGLARYQPHAASEVFSNGYGDCKDKNTLLASLLETEGFQSTSVLIGAQHKLDPDIPSPSQFDHVITRVPVDGQEIWLDSTNGVAPFRMLAASLRDKLALAIPPGGKPVLVTTPAGLPFEDYDRSAVKGSLNDTGTLKAHFSGSLRGDNELGLRFALRQMPENRWKEFFGVVLQHAGLKDADITNLKVSDPTNADNPLQIDLDFTTNNYFDWPAPESKMSLPLMLISLPGVDDDSDQTTTQPIKLGATGESRIDLQLAIPSKYIVHLPIPVDVRRDYADYHSTYKFDAGQFSSIRTLQRFKSDVPEQRREDYAAFRRVVMADQAQQVSLDNKSPGAAGAGSSQSADQLVESAVQAAQNSNFALAAELFQRVVQLEPKHKSAWNGLGGAYQLLGQNDKAIAAFQKQIEINPYDEYAYNNLGLVYEQQQRYDDAAKQFQKQIEINPLDQRAHASLGELYLRQRKFADAVPELEKAVDIAPDNPVLRISLGQAYIATRQTDKGMAAFEKAISLSPTPLVWNNISYALAEQNVQLDRAAQYADSAINATETQLRDVNLDNLRMQDLGTTQLLFALWDTKGWVEFKRGAADAAEQYITAAWLAAASGDEAEHLGEIYQKQGNRDQAIRYYFASLAGDRPSPDARTHLAQLGITGNLDARIKQAGADFQRQCTVPLHKTDRGTAEFYLLLSPAKVEQVKFIKGDDNLKGLVDLLQKADTGMKFPPGAQVHVVRRAIVRCGSTTAAPCTLELVPSSQVRSLQ